jgi:hypothetical protein
MENYLRQAGHAGVDLTTQYGRDQAKEATQDWGPDSHQRRRLNAILNEPIRYVGVAVTGCTGGAANALQRQGFSATRGGLMTVMNTGNDTIYPGQRVHMQLEFADLLDSKTTRTPLEGVNASKIVPHLAAVDEYQQLMSDLDGAAVTQGDIYVGINEPWPLMPLLAELVRERFPLRV